MMRVDVIHRIDIVQTSAPKGRCAGSVVSSAAQCPHVNALRAKIEYTFFNAFYLKDFSTMRLLKL